MVKFVYDNYDLVMLLADDVNELSILKANLKHQELTVQTIYKWLHAINETLKLLATCHAPELNRNVDDDVYEYIQKVDSLCKISMEEVQSESVGRFIPINFQSYNRKLCASNKGLQLLVTELLSVVKKDLLADPLTAIYVNALDIFASLISDRPLKLRPLTYC